MGWARPLLAATLATVAGFEELVNPRLGGEYSPTEVERLGLSRHQHPALGQAVSASRP